MPHRCMGPLGGLADEAVRVRIQDLVVDTSNRRMGQLAHRELELGLACGWRSYRTCLLVVG